MASQIILKNGQDQEFSITHPDNVGAVQINSNDIATKKYVDDTSIISGIIVMWSGSIATIPIGWALCDGANGTPDLRNRFVIGSSSDVSDVSNTSVTGANTKYGGSKDAVVVSHTHTGTSNSVSAGGTFMTNLAVSSSSGGSSYVGPSASGYTDTYLHKQTASVGAHTHTLTINSTGSSGTNANLPPYYALAFIMKI